LFPIQQSPTGVAILPQLLVKGATVLVGAAGLLLTLTTQGIALPPLAVTICTAVVSIGAALGIASQGVRK
jgi:hypothetical protein